MKPARLPLFVLVAVLSAGLAGCGSESTGEVAGPELLRMGADQLMIDVRHRMTRDGVLQARLRADTAYVFNEKSIVRFRNVDVTFFDETGRGDSHLTARRASYDLRTSDMTATGKVVVVDSTEGRRLETPRLEYRSVANQLRTDTSFVWHREGEVIRGQGMVTDPDMNEVHIERPAGRSTDTTSSGE